MIAILLAATLSVGLDEHVGAALTPSITFTAPDHHAVAIGELLRPNRPVLLVMAYARCEMLCSVVLRGVAEAVRTTDLVPGRDFLPVVVSIDPYETPDEAGRRQAKLLDDIGRPGDPAAWPYLVGDQGSVALLADELGFHYTWDDRTRQYMHPAVIFTIAPDGRIAQYLRGVTFPALDVALARAARGEFTTSGATDLVTCFHFDASLRKYEARVQLLYRLAGAGMLLALIGFVLGLVAYERRRR